MGNRLFYGRVELGKQMNPKSALYLGMHRTNHTIVTHVSGVDIGFLRLGFVDKSVKEIDFVITRSATKINSKDISIEQLSELFSKP